MPNSHVDRAVVYIAGPYSDDPVGGTRRAIDVAERLDETGIITAYVPHLNLLWDFAHSHTNEFWYDFDLCFLNRADALLRIPGLSPGADKELEFATDHDIECFYEIGELIAWAESFIAAP